MAKKKPNKAQPELTTTETLLTPAEIEWLTRYAEMRGSKLNLLLLSLIRHSARGLINGDFEPFTKRQERPVIPPGGMDFKWDELGRVDELDDND